MISHQKNVPFETTGVEVHSTDKLLCIGKSDRQKCYDYNGGLFCKREYIEFLKQNDESLPK